MILENLYQQAKDQVLPHSGDDHKIVVAWYSKDSNIAEISIECETCHEVLVTFPVEAA